MKTILLFAVPPLAGALIGFVTNVIAIRMLFRPLREIRVFGIRLPFTPGILPRQRRRLADSIGAMVERELLTPEILRQRLERDEVQEALRRSVVRLTGQALAMPAIGLLREGTVSEAIVTALLQSIPRLLHRPDIHRELVAQGRVFLTKALLNLSVLQRLVIAAGQYEETLHNRMPEIIDSLIEQMETRFSGPGFPEHIRACLDETTSLEGLAGLSGAQKQSLDSALCTCLLRLAHDQIENALSAINIRTLVSQRIDSLEMIRVERIILDVMANQFKWIDIFGAILGFIIGLFQVLFILLNT